MMPNLSQLLILIAVIVLLFGTKKLRSLGSDLGASIKGFKKAMSEDDDKKARDDSDKMENHNTANNDQDNKKE